MQRRAFLASASVAAGAFSLSFQPVHAAAGRGSRLQLWSSTRAERGAPYRPHALQPCTGCSADALQVHIDGLFPAASGPVFESLKIDALFDLPQGETAPFHAWQFSSRPLSSNSGPVQFLAGRAGMRRLELDYRLRADDHTHREQCALTQLDSALLSPGHYLLLSPRKSGESLAALTLEHSGDPLAPLTDHAARDFDYVALRIQAMA